MTSIPRLDIGDTCVLCPTLPRGTMQIENVDERCTCSDDAPCRYCIDKPLVCSQCGYTQAALEEDEEETDLRTVYQLTLTESQFLYVASAMCLTDDILRGEVAAVRQSAQATRFALVVLGEAGFNALRATFRTTLNAMKVPK